MKVENNYLSQNIVGTRLQLAYYATHPPTTPMCLVPISTSSQKIDDLEQHPDIINNESNIVVQQVLKLVLKSATIGEVSPGSASAIHVIGHDVAVQTSPESSMNRLVSEDRSFSSCNDKRDVESEDMWINDLRSLRDAYVQLVLRQLQQLQDVELINRTLKRAHSPQKCSCQIDSNSKYKYVSGS